MPYQTLELERRGQTAWIWMNRPDKHNAFDESLVAELTSAAQDIGQDAGVRALVLAGRGKSFSAGADMDWMRRQGAMSLAENLADARRTAEMFRTLAGLRTPTIARVHGPAIGGGMGLAAACDICVASTGAAFATPEVRLGLIPAVISPYVMRAIGARQCQRYFLTGERISAARARELGLVHELAEPEGLDACVQGLIEALAAGSPRAQASARDLIGAVTHKPITPDLAEETAQRIAECRASADARDGLSAFLEKRRPPWQP